MNKRIRALYSKNACVHPFMPLSIIYILTSTLLGECLQYYPSKTDGFQHFSVYNNKLDCEKNKGFWVEYSNYLEEYPKYQTQKECEAAASSEKLPLIWAIPYRSEDIDNFKMTGDNVDSLKRCLVGLDKPDCKKTPYSRSNHLGNGRDVVPLRYTWTIPHFPSQSVQRCILRIRLVEFDRRTLLILSEILHSEQNFFRLLFFLILRKRIRTTCKISSG